ncbi:MAG TPA: ABC transporter permease [Terracidiphilus sp.]|nr:ABC transporter permease [Terracidiphilus sp.]
MSLWSRMTNVFRPDRLNRDIDDELQSHIEEAIDAGRDPAEARRAFGSALRAREASHAIRASGRLEAFTQDVRFGVRLLIKNPGFTVVAVLTLALGIGGNTAIFSIVNGVLLNPLPFPHPEQLVSVHESKPNFDKGAISYPNFLDWRASNRSFAALAVGRGWSFSMTGRGDAVQLSANFISSGYFAVLGVRPLLGREFNRDEDQLGRPPVAMISEGLWRRKFNGAPGVLGQTIMLDGKNFSIVGVVPARLRLNIPGFSDQDVYAPVPQWGNSILMNRGAGLGFHGIARLKPGVSIEQARAEMDQVTSNLSVAYPDSDRGVGASLVPLRDQVVGNSGQFLLVLLAAVGFVLLIACVNVASLLMARSATRAREFAVRTALGASRGRVIRQLLTESLLLGIAGGALGLIPTIWGTQAALKSLPTAVPRAAEIGVDWRVLAFTMAVSLAAGVLFGLAPAWKSSQSDANEALKDSGRGTSGSHARILGALVVAEMAIAMVLLMGAALMVRSLVQLWNVDPGFNARNVLTFNVSTAPKMATASLDATRAMYREMSARFAAVSGVQALSQSWGALPLGGEDDQLFWVDGQPKPANDHDMGWVLDYIVDPDYLRVMQIPLLRGRFLTRQDDERAPLVAVVDEVFAHKYFPGQDPVGKRIHLVNNDGRAAEIVGMVAHVKQWGLDSDDDQSLRAEYYLPCMQVSNDFMAGMRSGTGFVLRYEGPLAGILESLRAVNKQMSGEQVLYGEQTMDSIVSGSMAARRFAMILLGSFAALALLLACVGIYGVMAYLVAQRTQEVGIRIALGAKRRDVLMLVFRRGAWLALIGVAAGVASAVALTRLMRELLFDVSPTDPVTLAATAALLVLVALAACVVPARRAASIEPVRALRME